MIYYPTDYYFGMNGLWWLFWIGCLVLMFAFAVPVPRKTWRAYRESDPLLMLQRRYASGEISTAEYEERKAILERDASRSPRRPGEHSAPAKPHQAHHV